MTTIASATTADMTASVPGDSWNEGESDRLQTAQATDRVPEIAVPADSPPNFEVSQDGKEMRIGVLPGQVIQLPPPFNAEGGLLAKIGDGNLAIKSGDTVVILEGYVDANEQAPITVTTATGDPIDIPTILAETDPNLDIQTAAGPAAGAQGADNSGALLTPFGPGAGLGGFTAVGVLDQTALSYKLIDNAIREERIGELSQGDDNNGPGSNPPSVGNSGAASNEAALSFGSNPSSDAETTSGTLLVNAPDGAATITIDGHPVDLSDPAKTPPIEGKYGELTVTGWNPATGELEYGYTLKDNFHHDPVQGHNEATGEDFVVTVTDKDGQSASGDITIDIVDDVPTARDDCAVVCACGEASGNVLANDTPGADGIIAITVFNDGGHTYTLDSSGALTSNDAKSNYSYDQATGVLEIFKTSGGGSLEIDLSGDHTGDYDYAQGKATAPDDFQYTVIDGDGDTSSADLNIQPDLSPPVAADDHIFAFQSEFSIANAWLWSNDTPENKIAVTDTGNFQNLTIADLDWGQDIELDPGKTSGGFDYEITADNGKTDTAHVTVNLVSDCGHTIDQSASLQDLILIGDGYGNVLKGGAGDDILVGGGGIDHLYGNGGNDDFLYSNLDLFHGGSGIDRVSFSDPVTIAFDSGLVSRIDSVEVLDFRNGGADTAGAGKGEALTPDAVLDMTDGKGEIWIAGESSDSVTLDKGFTQGAEVTNTTAADGIPNGSYASFTATDGTHSVTVHIDTSVAVHT